MSIHTLYSPARTNTPRIIPSAILTILFNPFGLAEDIPEVVEFVILLWGGRVRFMTTVGIVVLGSIAT
jgi:hypothetical protein